MISFKPTRTTIESDYFILEVNEIKILKNP